MERPVESPAGPAHALLSAAPFLFPFDIRAELFTSFVEAARIA
jgi:hypothetical protein